MKKLYAFAFSILLAFNSFSQSSEMACTLNNFSNSGNNLCFGNCNGTGTASAAAGLSPYTFLWSTGQSTTTVNLFTPSTVSGLCAGTYTVTMREGGGSTCSRTFTITAPTQIQTFVVTNNSVTCNGGNNGSAQVASSGGTGTLRYVWNPSGQTTALATGLSAGTYTVTTRDNNNCTITTAVTITQPPVLNTSTNSTTVSCFGGSNGTATISPSGGTSPYTYSWNPTGKTTATATGLSAGTYTVTVTQSGGCVSTVTVAVTQPTALNSTVNSLAVSCNGGNNGIATVNVVGGTAPYTYLWNPSGKVTSIANGLTAGTYTVTVTDNRGCIQTASVVVTQPTAIVVTPTTVGNTATANASGGTGAFTYSWNPSGQTTATATGLSTGTYTVTVTDNNGCTKTATVNVITTGISSSVKENGLNIYPNPASDHITIEMNFDNNTQVKISITNIIGEAVYEENLNVNKQMKKVIDISKFAKGSYIVSVKSADKAISQKVLKN